MGGESAVKLLTKFGLLDAALEFATENNSFDFAFELSKHADKYKLAEVNYKYGNNFNLSNQLAMYLEDEGRYKEAESAFIESGKPREAILMHVHNQDWVAALAIAEKYDPQSINEVLVGQAKVAFDNKDFSKGEGLILRAQRPEAAIKYYKEANLWKEALRFTKEYVPTKIGEINQEYQKHLSSSVGSGRDEIIANAKTYEQQKDYSLSIDMYLRLSTDHTNDLNFLVESWEYALKLAVKFLPERIAEVARLSGDKMIEIKRFELAGDLFFAVELYKDAIDAYIAGNLWDKTKDVLQKSPKYSQYVETMYKKLNLSDARETSLVTTEIVANIEECAQRGDWAKCVEIAASKVNS